MAFRKSQSPMLPPPNVNRRYAETLPPGDRLALETLFALRASTQGVENALSQWLGIDALTPGRWQVLVVLWAADAPLPQREIVTALKVSRPTVSGLVETLVREGHVIVTPDIADKRQVLVELTPDGRRMAGRLVAENAHRLRQTFSGVTDEQLRQLADLLRGLMGETILPA